MELTLNGSTRVYFVVGDPIAQVKSPEGMTAAFQAAGINGVCLPAHVAPDDLADWAAGIRKMKNADGLMVTVPHKIAFAGLCDEISDTARFLNTVNVVRFSENGWHGEMFDGRAQVEALLKNGAVLQGKKAVQAGAGGAGTAIAHALVTAGVSELAIVETDVQRRDSLIERLNSLGRAKVYAGTSDPSGFDIVVNATPLGMKAGDPLPFDGDKLTAEMFVGDVVTYPDTAWITKARAQGCRVSTGLDMYAAVRDLMADFLLQKAV
ncbi:shikimate dehydrogenase family protein [Bergeriella denitrificans]|uniref:Shikimate dehydrogenase n=1 Tax=Bergeriella denitrificans TaxID=494 RepID=A0A378UFQ3_BERDE|nr:shikimate dehydrogenase [Bergeriella denitrificans]STZ76000.1 Shikimate dehydrogenase [Bergeriella denitrificans]